MVEIKSCDHTYMYMYKLQDIYFQIPHFIYICIFMIIYGTCINEQVIKKLLLS